MQLRNAGQVRRGKIRITPEWQRLILHVLAYWMPMVTPQTGSMS